MKTKQKTEPGNNTGQPPVVVAIPNTTETKLIAALELARGMAALARVLESVNVNITVSNCSFFGAETAVDIHTKS